MRNERAFTLIEMIAVIVIIGIIVAVGIPAMTGLTRAAGLQGGVRQVMNAAQLTRQFAITHRTATELRIQTTSFAVFTNNLQIDKTTFLPVGVVVDFLHSSPSANSIVFMPTGALGPSASDQFIAIREGSTNNATLVALNSNMSTVTVNAILGRVTVQ